MRKIAELMPGASGAEVKVTRVSGRQKWQEAATSKGFSGFEEATVSQLPFPVQGVCTEAGMYALRERRVHVTQEDFEMAVAKVHVSIVLILLTVTQEQRLRLVFTTYAHICVLSFSLGHAEG